MSPVRQGTRHLTRRLASVFPRTHLAGMPCGGEIGHVFALWEPVPPPPTQAQPKRRRQAGEMHGFTAVTGSSLLCAPVSRRSSMRP